MNDPDMSQSNTTHCWIYRCSKRDEMYLYLAREDDFDCVPDSVQTMLGQLTLSMDLDLSSERKLARVEVNTVIDDLTEHGFHIQLPPNHDQRWQS